MPCIMTMPSTLLAFTPSTSCMKAIMSLSGPTCPSKKKTRSARVRSAAVCKWSASVGGAAAKYGEAVAAVHAEAHLISLLKAWLFFAA